MMHSYETPLSAPFVYNYTTAYASPGHLFSLNNSHVRARIASSRRLLAFLLFLVAGCLPLILSGCGGGKLSGDAATGTTAGATSAADPSLLSCTSATITGAGTDSCTVKLSAAAPSGGITVSLASSSSAVKVPSSVTVAAGATSAGFTAAATAVTTAQTVTLSASASGVTKTFALQLGVGAAGTGGTTPTSYDVNLTWNAPTSSSDPVAGYYVYRSPSGGTSYQQLNSSPITQTAYTDTSVTDGQTYDYIVESVDASGSTSVPSNTASVVIP